ncbi:MAG: alpha/beta hydrolase [Lachnospiraceae bacterium]|nr:alpha/beta hydrolase [Lachnospiraceae bacterium]
MSFQSFMIRTLFKHGDDKRDAGLSTPDDIVRYDDIQYGSDPKWNVLDVYRPKDVSGKLPVIISIHGGGWVYGDKERYQYYCMSLAKHGFAVINFTYHLAPKYKFPTPLCDTNDVIAWMFEHADTYEFDTDHVFGVGDSAGAHLWGLYACACTNPSYASTLPFEVPFGFRPTALALNCGAYEIKKSAKADLTTSLMADFLPQKGTDAEFAQINVLNHVTEKFPPSLVMTCEGDFLVQQAPLLVERLKKLGVPATYRYYGDKDHVLGHVFHCNMKLDEAHACNKEECDYFKTFCK